MQHCHHALFADEPYRIFKENLEKSHKFRALSSTPSLWQVEIPNTQSRWEVDIRKRSCTCKRWKELSIPCPHAIRAILACGKDPLNEFFFSSYYTIRALRHLYDYPVRPILIEDLRYSDSILPPEFRRQAGRPKMKRIRRQPQPHVSKREITCSSCGEKGHNKATCTNGPRDNGRAQRIRDIILDIDSRSDDEPPQNSDTEGGATHDQEETILLDSDCESNICASQQSLQETIWLEDDGVFELARSNSCRTSAGSIAISASPTAESAAPIIDPQRTPSPYPTGRRHRRFSEITDSPNTPETSTIVVQLHSSPHLPERPRRQVKKPRTLVEEWEEQVDDEAAKWGAKIGQKVVKKRRG